MNEKFKRPLYFYQRIFFYVGQAKNELLKPLGFWNETIAILTLLTVSGYKPGLTQTVLAYIILLLLLAVAGKIILSLGIAKFNTSLGNYQNPELTRIDETVSAIKRDVEEIKKKLEDQGGK